MSLSFYSPPAWPHHEQQRQRVVDQAIARCHGLRPALQQIVEQAARSFDVPIAAISIIDQDRQWFAGAVGLDVVETSRATSFCGHSILNPAELLIVPDATDDHRFAGNPLVLYDPHIRFYAGAPLVDASGNAVGALCVVDSQARPDAGNCAQLRLLAREAAALLFG